MTALDFGCIAFAVLAGAYSIRWYIELRRWAHLIQYARIVIAFKNKVKLQAPLQEWALWCKMLESDKDSNGRVVYMMGGTRVAIIRKSFVPDPPLKRALKWTRDLVGGPGQVAKTGPQVREGTWSAEDHTEKVTK